MNYITLKPDYMRSQNILGLTIFVNYITLKLRVRVMGQFPQGLTIFVNYITLKRVVGPILGGGCLTIFVNYITLKRKKTV